MPTRKVSVLWVSRAVAAALVVVAVVAVAFALRPDGVGVAEAPVGGFGDLDAAAQKCVAMQMASASADIDERTFECMYDLLSYVALSGRSGELVSDSAPYARPEMWATCHAVGHSLGPALLESGMSPDEAIVAALGAQPHERADVFCAAAVVHGVVDGVSVGAGSEDLERIASYCAYAHRAHPYYGSECAHYFGHTVWDVTSSAGVEAAEACALLEPFEVRGGLESCMGGAVMARFGLQEAAYGAEVVGVSLPDVGEVLSLCGPLEDYGFRAFDGCWGGAGWLLSKHLIATMNEIDPKGEFAAFPQSLVGEALEAHSSLLEVCGTPNCVATLLQHMRPQEWTNGLGHAVCEGAPPAAMSGQDFDRLCRSLFYGLGG